MFRGRVRHVHFVGVGGIGMSGLAEILRSLEFDVSGSDIKDGDTTRRLASLGVRIDIGHRAENVRGVDVVVFSSAVSKDNPELVEASSLGIPIIPRAEMLAELMRLKYGVAIAGSHGKTTTTSLVATVLRHAGLDPTVVVGAKMAALLAWPEAYEDLRICWSAPNKDENCGTCGKCALTLLGFRFKKLPLPKSFPKGLSEAMIESLELDESHLSAAETLLRFALREPEQAPWVAALRKCVGHNRKRLNSAANNKGSFYGRVKRKLFSKG